MKRCNVVFAGVIALAFLAIGCNKAATGEEEKLSCIQLIDRNGINEMVDHQERLAQLATVNFLEPQPYQKVVRVYKRDTEGKTHGKVSAYHENGSISEYLETSNGRANGKYQEWHANGNLRISAKVIEGMGDLSPSSKNTWLFDETSEVYDEGGKKIAEIRYEKGRLEGTSTYFYLSGAVSKTIPYQKDKINGEVKMYDEEGGIIGATNYIEGKKHGPSFSLKTKQVPRREEEYKMGILVRGKYWNMKDEVISEIHDGNGIRPTFEEGRLKMEHEYRNGVPEGLVKKYRKSGMVENSYLVIDGLKQGEEWYYFEQMGDSETLQPQLHIHWKDDEVHGVVRTWFLNGNIESEREMAGNKKQGYYIAWYESGDLMMVEEYNEDMLINGKYMKKGEEIPTTRVIGGNGTVSLFDPKGNFLRKIEYQKSEPVN